MSAGKRCVKCGAAEVEVLFKQPTSSGIEYTYKCMVCHHTWKEKKRL